MRTKLLSVLGVAVLLSMVMPAYGQMEACCMPDGTCVDIDAMTCTGMGGTPQGPGTICMNVVCTTTPPEACCDPTNGTCSMELPNQCILNGDVPAGPGTVCLGDTNGDGIDDICEGGTLKWYHEPDINDTGIDVMATEPLVLADDFLCTRHSLITHITIWGSWKGDILPDPEDASKVSFTLSFHTDIPDPDGEQGDGYSMPGQVLWIKDFAPGTFEVTPHMTGLQEAWWDPSDPSSYIWPGDTICWKYDFWIPNDEAFCQMGDEANPMVYWLDVQATPEGSEPDALFGWKTSIDHWNDDAVWGEGVEPYTGPWYELRYPTGVWQGESIDLAFALEGDEPCDYLDFGDAPDPTYPTLLANNGARHVIVPGMFLGALIDGEADGQPDATATGDDLANLPDEDGVAFTGPLYPGTNANIVVIASVGGRLDAWVDFNGNGSWAEPVEQIFGAPLLFLNPGPNPLTFPVPANAILGPTFARFRFSSNGGLTFTGQAPDGEVEDYEIVIEPAKVIGRYVFYNNSWFDGNDPNPNANDDNAIATDKTAYLGGGVVATFANYISYSRGINGVMIDIQGLPGVPTTADFAFKVGNDNNPAGWAAGPAPTSVTVRPGAGIGGSDRVTVIFADNAMPPVANPAIINNTSNKNWLEVMVAATANTGLLAPDVHYWGLAVGEVGNMVGNTDVNATDEIQARLNPRNFFAGWALITDPWDFDRDRSVNATDEIIARLNPANFFTGKLALITLP